MSGSRDRVLANVRAALNRSAGLPPSVTRGLDARLRHPRPNVRPRVPRPLLECFVAKLQAVNARVSRVADFAEVPARIIELLDEYGLGHRLVMAPAPELDALRWSNRLQIERRAAVDADRVSVTGAFAGVAETGTLVLLSGAESPTTLNFLPEDHVVVLPAERVVAYLEDVWVRLRKVHKQMPRTVNCITGPSKTADVELTLQEGAHGPRRLHVVIVGD